MTGEEAAPRKERTDDWKRTLFRWAVFLELLALFAFAYVRIGGHLIAQTNNSTKAIRGHDQLHNMRLATQTREDLHPDFRKGFSNGLMNLLPHRTDGVVQPLWPWIAAWFVDADHKITEEDFAEDKPLTDQTRDLFRKGKWFHISMTLGFLAMLGIAACRIFSFPAACNLVLLGGLGALLPRSVYFQPEPIYFILFFLTWVACVSALQHISMWIYGVIGALGGVAYLEKGSISPLLMIFIGVSTLRCLWEIFSARRRGYVLTQSHHWHWRHHFVGVVVLAVTHLVVAGPRLAYAHERYGSAFHSYPGYWMWFDNYPQAYEWMGQHNTPETLAAILPDEKPSLSNWLRTHDRSEFISRLWNGTRDRVTEFFWPKQTKMPKLKDKFTGWRGILEWRGLYLAWLFLMVVALVIVVRFAAPQAQHAGHVVFRHGTVSIILFTLGAFAVYSLSYGWYAPIARGSGDRFMLSLYLPLVFSFIWAAESIIRRIRRRQGNPWITRGYLAAQWLLFAALSWRLIEVLRMAKFYNA
jgi:hypothetical protein